jgi:AcrR family transcriptional regulator
VRVVSTKSPQGKTEKSKKKRELILRAAAKVFKEKGYAQTTLSDIAALADTYSGSMYYYFASKDHLVEQVLNIGTTSVSEVVMKRMARAKKGAAVLPRLRLALETHLMQMLKRDDFIVAYWKIIDQVPAEIRERHNKLPRLYGKFWTELIKEGQSTGELRADLDANIVQLLLVGSSIYSLMWYREEGRLSVDEIADVLIEMFFNGMRPREGGPAAQLPRKASNSGAKKPPAQVAGEGARPKKRKSAGPKTSGPVLARSIALTGSVQASKETGAARTAKRVRKPAS